MSNLADILNTPFLLHIIGMCRVGSNVSNENNVLKISPYYDIYSILQYSSIHVVLFVQDQAILKYVCTSLRELRDTADAHNIDPEAYFRLVLLARGVSVPRPQHLVQYTAPAPPRPENGNNSHKSDSLYTNLTTNKTKNVAQMTLT